MVIGIIALVIGLASIGFALHMSLVFEKMNATWKNWAEACVDEANRTLQSNARIIERNLNEVIDLKLKSYGKENLQMSFPCGENDESRLSTETCCEESGQD